ncbi:alpha-hydroxy acid oxidase [Streptomyces sp. NPDC059788]|uniref:alpha-hydroxy acid oxidase n=1 Tax=Streptomyces sp. NPDC059788 TaxID=3346948 RepID=UPI003654005E
MEEQARAVLDPAAYDFYAAGAGDETSLAEAPGAWRTWRLLPRVLRDVSRVRTTLDLLGTPLSSPVLAAPTAFHLMADPEGEVATARGVAAAGSLLVLSSRATRRVEEVAAAAGPWWQQIYALRDRDATARTAEAAAAAGAGALVLTVDAPYLGTKPRVRRPLPLPDNDLTRAVGLHTRGPGQEQDPSTGPEAIGRLHRLTGLPVLVKGVLRADDARHCVQAGAAGVIVSNHGGRQLDRALSTAHALRAVAHEVGTEVPVLADGGIRTGTDVLTALALGAHAVLIGRPVLWALAVAGASGVQRLLDTCTEELSDAMALAGVRTLSEIGPDLLTGP